MPFPKATLEWANDIKEELLFSLGTKKAITTLESIISKGTIFGDVKKAIEKVFLRETTATETPELHPREKKAIAALLYYGIGHRYGFQASLETNNWMPYPHELMEVNCYSQAVANFVATKALGFDPKLIEFIGIRQEKHTDLGGHSLVVINVGTKESPEYWTIDQPQGMFGPIRLEDNKLTVENQDQTYSRRRVKSFNFLSKLESGEEEVLSQIDSLRSNPKLVIQPGQRVGIKELDSWQSEEPISAAWYIKFEETNRNGEQGDVVSRIFLGRPGIKSRGLEYRLSIGEKGDAKEERLLGYYCEDLMWADFVKAIPLVNLDYAEAVPLLVGLDNIPLEKRSEFERTLMKESVKPSAKYKAALEVARESYKRALASEYKEIILTLAAVESLYQYEKGDKDDYLTEEERRKEVQRIRGKNILFSEYAKLSGELELRRKSKGTKRRLRINKPAVVEYLIQDRREDPRVRAFLALETEEAMIEEMISHNPLFFYDAVDRLIFYNRRIKGGMDEINSLARSTFKERYEEVLFGGYTKIFAEFLGHFSATLPELSLQKYRSSILRKFQ